MVLVLALAVVGAAISTYLLTVHWGWTQAVCLGVGGCEAVNASRYAEFFGVPIALIGLGGYVVIGALAAYLAFVRAARIAQFALFGAAVGGVAFSIYLTYIELFVLYQICPWCVFSAIVITAIAVLSAVELLAPLSSEE